MGKKFISSISLFLILVIATLLFLLPTARTSAQFIIGDPRSNDCENAHGGGSGDFVPVCEVNPRIVYQYNTDLSFLDDLITMATEQPETLSEILQQGGMPAEVVLDPSILGNLQNLNMFFLFDEFIFKYIKEQFKLQAIDSMANQTARLATGDGQNPQFIQNWEDYTASAYDTGYYSVGSEIVASQACPEFKEQLLGGLIKGYTGGSVPQTGIDQDSLFIPEINCTLNDVTDPAAYSQDFANGGWDAYAEQNLKPQNNYMGALFLAMDEADKRAGSKANAAQNEGIANNSYTPIKQCVETDSVSEQCIKTRVTTPGSVFSSALDASVQSRFNYVANSDQYQQILNTLLNSFTNKLSAAGTEGLYGYGQESQSGVSGGYLGAPEQQPASAFSLDTGLRWSCYDAISGNAIGSTFSEANGGLAACREQTTCGTTPARCGLCMPEGGVDCVGDSFYPLPGALEGAQPLWPELAGTGAQPVFPEGWLEYLLGLFDWDTLLGGIFSYF